MGSSKEKKVEESQRTSVLLSEHVNWDKVIRVLEPAPGEALYE